MTNNNFLPEGYELPVAPSNYTKFEDGETVKIRILPSGMDNNCIVFWQYFDESGDKPTPRRSQIGFKETPGMRSDRKVSEVWAFKVWNYNLNQVQICSLSQKSIKSAIMGFINDEDYGDPLGYDIKIKRTGQALDTEYAINPAPPREFDEVLLKDFDKTIDWLNYLNSEDPFDSL